MATPLTKRGMDPGHNSRTSVRRGKKTASDALSSKTFSQLTPAEKDTLLQLLGERFKLIAEE